MPKKIPLFPNWSGELYPVNSYVKLNPENWNQKWYTKDIYRVIGHVLNNHETLIYQIDKDLPNIDNDIPANQIHPALIIRDEECIKLERKEKLQQLG